VIAAIYNSAKVGISHNKYTTSEGNSGGEIFDLRYKNDFPILYYFEGILMEIQLILKALIYYRYMIIGILV